MKTVALSEHHSTDPVLAAKSANPYKICLEYVQYWVPGGFS
jgi:hypothetical protein